MNEKSKTSRTELKHGNESEGDRGAQQASMKKQPFRARLMRFGLRTILALTALIAIGLGYLNFRYDSVLKAVNLIQRPGNEFDTYNTEKDNLNEVPARLFMEEEPEDKFALPPRPDWEQWIFRIKGIELDPRAIKRVVVRSELDNLNLMKQFPNLKNLTVHSVQSPKIEPLEELTQLTRLSLSSPNLTSLDTIASLPELETLSINESKVDDLSPISGCTKLHTLEISDSNVVSLEPIRKLTSLVSLDLSDSPVEDIEPLKDLKIVSLYLAGTKVHDLSPLRRAELVELDISRTPVQSVVSLGERVTLSTLKVDHSELSDLDGISRHFADSRSLDLSGTKIFDLSPLKVSNRLRTLRLTDTELKSLESLPNARDINKLYVSGKLESLSGLEKFQINKSPIHFGLRQAGWISTLRSLEIGPCSVSDLSLLSELKYLQDLRLKSIPATTLPPLKTEILRRIDFQNVGVVDFDFLVGQKHLYALKFCSLGKCDWGFLNDLVAKDKIVDLWIEDADLGDLSAVGDMSGLESLTLINCNCSGYEKLAKLNWLENLRIECASLKDIGWLTQLSSLRRVSLAGSGVTDISPLGQASLTHVNLSGVNAKNFRPLGAGSRGSLVAAKLDNTLLNDIEFVSEMPELVSLNISNTKVKNLQPIKNLPLRELQMEGLDLSRRYVARLLPSRCKVFKPKDSPAASNFFETRDSDFN